MEIKRLYRSREDRIFFGLCGGLGEYFGIDPTLVRIAFVLLAIPGAFGILAYILISIIVPLQPGAKKMDPKDEAKDFAKRVKKEAKEVAAEIKEIGKELKKGKGRE